MDGQNVPKIKVQNCLSGRSRILKKCSRGQFKICQEWRWTVRKYESGRSQSERSKNITVGFQGRPLWFIWSPKFCPSSLIHDRSVSKIKTVQFYPHGPFTLDKIHFKINSRGPIVLLKDGLVLQVTETSDYDKKNWWNLHVSCKILSAYHSYRYFGNLTLLSVIYSFKTRGRSAFFREIYNLSTFITYEMRWNFYF